MTVWISRQPLSMTFWISCLPLLTLQQQVKNSNDRHVVYQCSAPIIFQTVQYTRSADVCVLPLRLRNE